MDTVHVLNNTGKALTSGEFASIASTACNFVRQGYTRKVYFESNSVAGIMEATGRGEYISGAGTLFTVQMDAVLGTVRSVSIIVYDGLNEHSPDPESDACTISSTGPDGYNFSIHGVEASTVHPLQ